VLLGDHVTSLPARLLLTLALMSSACSSSYDTGEAVAEALPEAEVDDEGKKTKKGRTYANPDSKMTPGEQLDILAICTAIVNCDSRKCTRGQETTRYKKIQVASDWGKLMVKHMIAAGRDTAGKRVARLLVQEDMKWASADCRSVLKKYSNQYQ
jgi:hypothetical protein